MRRLTIFASLLAFCFTGCGEKSVEDKEDDERANLRKEKRAAAIVLYNRLPKEFPASPNAEAAASRARVLESQKNN